MAPSPIADGECFAPFLPREKTKTGHLWFLVLALTICSAVFMVGLMQDLQARQERETRLFNQMRTAQDTCHAAFIRWAESQPPVILQMAEYAIPADEWNWCEANGQPSPRNPAPVSH